MQTPFLRSRHKICASDFRPLITYCHESETAPLASIVIAPGMAIGQRFYADFALYLAGLGYRVWTFDYRGMFESATGPMRHCTADLNDWILLDTDAVVRHAHAAGHGHPVFLVGHSLGGQAAPLLPSAAQLSGLVNIAVGSGAMRHNQPATRRKAPLLWFGLVPLLSTLFGYFAGTRVGLIGDVPRHAMAQWRKWCLNRDYLLGAVDGARAAYARARYPVLALAFFDDELLHTSGSRMLHDAYTGTEVDYRELSAAHLGVPRIGHVGFFRRQVGAACWPVVGDWLRGRMTQLSPPPLALAPSADLCIPIPAARDVGSPEARMQAGAGLQRWRLVARGRHAADGCRVYAACGRLDAKKLGRRDGCVERAQTAFDG